MFINYSWLSHCCNLTMLYGHPSQSHNGNPFFNGYRSYMKLLIGPYQSIDDHAPTISWPVHISSYQMNHSKSVISQLVRLLYIYPWNLFHYRWWNHFFINVKYHVTENHGTYQTSFKWYIWHNLSCRSYFTPWP